MVGASELRYGKYEVVVLGRSGVLMQEFLTNNWLSIASILIGVIVAYVFYRLQRKDAVSASAERKKHAIAELLDVVESYIINKQEISLSVVENLIHASERSHLVDLRPSCTPITLLQDVALRLQRSRHLDIPQKSEYSVKIDKLIRVVRAEMTPLTWEEMNAQGVEIIQEVVTLVPEDRRTEVAGKLKSLGMIGALAIGEREVLKLKLDMKSSKLGWAASFSSLIAGVASALAASSFGTKYLLEGNVQSDVLSGTIISVMVWGLVIAICCTVAVFAFQKFKKPETR